MSISQVKVLYSFDNENKTNCLARWPQPIDVRTANLDENTQIGIVELKTCIQAIVAASPELVAKLGQDYTVYAYDYSEYETPLVGQGMLSWVLASSSATPSAPAHQSRTIVTGRVCKNILGLFSSSSQETLEVKLRLVPVPTSLQSEYLESMKKYRDISQMMPHGFDMQAWTQFLQANPSFLQVASQSRSQSPALGSAQGNGFGIEHIQRLLSGDNTATKVADASSNPPQNTNTSSLDAGAHMLRPSSAASSIQSTAPPKKRGRPPGVRTNARGRGRTKKVETRQTSVNPVDPGYMSNEERFEEGPDKKRAKVTQAEWSGKADFGKPPESLRIAASTAASVRIHQPTALRPNNALANALEGPPREPTPIADSSNRMQRPLLPAPKSSLRRESFALDARHYTSPYAPLEGPINTGESAMTSPEASQAESSPLDIASSPPVYRCASTVGSSPNLPTLPHFDDSGFMSGSIDDLFEDDEMRPVDDEDLEIASQYIRRHNLPTAPETHEALPQLPKLPPVVQPPPKENSLEVKAAEQKRQMAANARLLTRTASSGNLLPPPVPASDPIRPTALHRSQTWSGNQEPHPMSDLALMPGTTDASQRPMPGNRRESETCTAPVARRKQAIQSKLASSIAAGEMPPFCENCGAIDTPTWRKAWIKIHSGSPEHVVISEEEGGIVAWQSLQTDHEGNVCLYRIIKKKVLKTDEGFTEVLLCNRKCFQTHEKVFSNEIVACGLWLHSRKCMRPKEVWEKPPNGGDGKRKRPASGKRQRTDSGSDVAAANAPSGAALYSDSSSPANGGQNDGMEEPRLPVLKHRRASSDQVAQPHGTTKFSNNRAAMAALQRAIKSSPHKFGGTEDAPIEVGDLTPQPTRRLLFRSPTRSHEARSKGHSVSGKNVQRAKPKAVGHVQLDIAEQADKENCPPTEGDSLDQLFEEDACPDVRSKTPTRTSSKKATLLRTPLRSPERHPPSTGDFFSSAAKALLRSPITPKRSSAKETKPLGELTPFTAHLNQLLSETNNGSPGSQTFDFPSLPSLRNTPGRATRNIDFDFSQFDSQDLLSTDVPMPSSPPAWFDVYADPVEHGDKSLWGDYDTPWNEETLEAAMEEQREKVPDLDTNGGGQPKVDVETVA